MTDHLLTDMAEKLFAQNPTWDDITAAGLETLLMSEAQGGFGGSWQDAYHIFRLAGNHALAHPLPETILAHYLIQDLMAQNLTGKKIGIAAQVGGICEQQKFTGKLSHVSWGRELDYVIAPLDDQLLLLDCKMAERDETQNFLSQATDDLNFTTAPVEILVGAHDVMALAAMMRAAQMAGAMDKALAIAVNYVNERDQFGKKIGKFQAVQQNLAVCALEAAAANAASLAACIAATRGDYRFEAAAAKLRCNIATSEVTKISHQVHGAIGFTAEYHLHPYTKRLWMWRSEFGNDNYWARELGRIASAHIVTSDEGEADFWHFMIARHNS